MSEENSSILSTQSRIRNVSLEHPLISRPEELLLCQYCKNEVIPNRIYEPTTLTWLVGGGICMVGCWFGICLAPLCSNSFQVATVYCSYCNKVIRSAEFTS